MKMMSAQCLSISFSRSLVAKFDLGLFEYDPASETAMNISKDIQQNILQQNFRGISVSVPTCVATNGKELFCVHVFLVD